MTVKMFPNRALTAGARIVAARHWALALVLASFLSPVCAAPYAEAVIVERVKQTADSINGNPQAKKAFTMVVAEGTRLLVLTVDLGADDVRKLHELIAQDWCRNILVGVAIIPYMGGEIRLETRTRGAERVTTLTKANCKPPRPTKAELEAWIPKYRALYVQKTANDPSFKFEDVILVGGAMVVVMGRYGDETAKNIASLSAAERVKRIEKFRQISCSAEPIGQALSEYGYRFVIRLEGKGMKPIEVDC
jgi:hypothetical protein